MRRLLEGQRVHHEIKNMARDAHRSTGNRDPSAALGRTVPRSSDNDLLDDYAGRLENGEAGATSLSGV